MARRAAFDVEAGRRFLAGLPEFQPTKPLSEYKPATIRRYTEQFQQQLRSGVPLSRQAARGHVVTPEHGPKGGRPKLPAAAQEYRGGKLPKSKYARRTKPLPQPRVHRRPVNVPEREDLADGAVVMTHTELGPTLLNLRANGDERVILTGYDCEHNIYRSLGVNVGHSRGWTARAMLESWAQSGLDFEDWFIVLANSSDSDPEQAAATMGHVCLWQIYVYPRNPHLTGFSLRAPASQRHARRTR